MKYIISYDVGDSYTRKQMSDYLKSYGFVRIQKSVFLGSFKINYFNKNIAELKSLLKNKKDSIIVCPIDIEDFEKSSFLGKQFNFEMREGFKFF